ncbi:hypothetical protein ACLBX9_26345 [Methylobacterium sp. A49B]
MTSANSSNLAMECGEIIQTALESLAYFANKCSSEDERSLVELMLKEYQAFSEIKNTLIDEESGMFITEGALKVVTMALQRAATEIFGDQFPIMQYKALDLVVRLREAGERTCLPDEDFGETTLH